MLVIYSQNYSVILLAIKLNKIIVDYDDVCGTSTLLPTWKILSTPGVSVNRDDAKKGAVGEVM